MLAENTTFINPIGLGFTLVMGLLIIVLPRRFALVPVIILTCFMTMGERVVVLSLDFTMLRILMLFGWIRLVLRNEIHSIKLNGIDKALLWWILASITTYTLLWQTPEALINRLGQTYNAVGMYFLFRFLVRNLEDVKRVFKILAVFLVPLAISMLVERTSGRNAFAVFGGVNAITVVRDGVLRCQGPFAHPILAGTFGATALPLVMALWWQGGSKRFLALAGVTACTVITVTAGSSSPVMTYVAAIVGLAMWVMRRHMRAVRWGLLLAVIGLHLVMKAPVWALIGRVGIFSGSQGWHRAYLITQAIANLEDWWLIGTKDTSHWGYYLFDVTNQYIAEGKNGGLITMFLFVLIIARCFGGVGRALHAHSAQPRSAQFSIFALGAALLAHVVTFLSVSYFDQNYVMWYLLLAIISTTSVLPSTALEAGSNAAFQSKTHQPGLGLTLSGYREPSPTRPTGAT